ncbi:MAG: beta-galactosidase [Clostridia bacterium]|nr:beta-galactosidase [Clostridia bacterium]
MRITLPIFDSWLFVHRSDCDPALVPEDAVPVTLPHSWNAIDGHDGHAIHIPTADWSQGDLSGKPMNKYDRGTYWYYRTIQPLTQPLDGGRLYVEIPAASLIATVYVNGVKAAYHEGGFSCFRADITDLVKPQGNNLLAICVSNEYTTNVYPQYADFTFYGGLYRGVNLISVARAHFDLDYSGAPGVMVTPVLMPGGDAVFTIESFVKGTDENDSVQYTLLSPDGSECALTLVTAEDTRTDLLVPKAQTWSPASPALYTLLAQIIRRNEVVDEVSVKCGVRSFSVSPTDGFFLNGDATPLRGVCRHQDRLYKGYAISKEDHEEDARLIKELGANTIRLAHYQHAQDFYDACDRLGLVVWAEIPFITIMAQDPKAHDNCISQMKELIYQNYNHPCICFWGLSNEVLLAGKPSDELVANHRDLEKLVKSLDPTRLTTLAHVSNTPEDSELHDITDVEAWNHYFGWYVGSIEDNAKWLDRYHEKYPDRAFAVSEYGCEGILTFHSSQPEPKDYSEEYQALYHETMARIFAERPFVWGSFLWNMFDFGAAERNEGGVAGRNNKGLMTLDRKLKKDAYYIYKAWWNPEPMVHICGKRYAKRAGETTAIRVYSNLSPVSLYVNGTLHSVQSGDKVFVFSVSLNEGSNTIVASAGAVCDSTVLTRVDVEPEIYVLPAVRARHALKDTWLQDVEGKGDAELDRLLEAKEGFYSVHDSIRTLSQGEQTSALLKEALMVIMRAEPGQPDLTSPRFERLLDLTLLKMLGTDKAENKKLLASLNSRFGEIAKA